MRRDLPTGNVSYLFTDVEGSTQLLHEMGVERYAAALADHRRILRDACARNGGIEVDTQGDSFFIAFASASGAVAAAVEARDALGNGPIRLRMGIHTGTARVSSEGYVGSEIHKGARIAAAGHGGQVLLSAETRALIQADVLYLGEHRLKDFETSVSIFQLGEDRFPPLNTISNSNLPHPPGRFVGRDREVTEIVARLQGGARLLTLTGPGGSGKTRLALEVASDLLPNFLAGVFWVDLAPLRDQSLVIEAIGQTLGARGALVDHIGERQLLLLLDNFEQVVEAAAELGQLIDACPNLRVLVTSRERLRIKAEVDYPVSPLSDVDAAQLFADRSRMEPDPLVHELCRALDNLPLALELAAARTGVLSPRQLLDRFSSRLDLLKGGRDGDPRQQTLRATLQWSYELLKPDEQRLLARLSIFRGGWTLQAAEMIVGADLDTLQSLIDKSLVRYRDERFSMLETIREFAAECLESPSELADLARAHAHFTLEQAKEQAERLRESDSGDVMRMVADEAANARAAMEWSLTFDGSLALRLASALHDAWRATGAWSEGRRLTLAALDCADASSGARLDALLSAASLSGLLCRYGEAIELGQDAWHQVRTTSDRRAQLGVAGHLSGVLAETGSYRKAVRWGRMAVALAYRIGSARLIAACLLRLAATQGLAGERASALENLRLAKAHARDVAARDVGRAIAGEEAYLHAVGGDVKAGWTSIQEYQLMAGGSEPAEERAAEHETKALLHLAAGDLDGAQTAYEEALQLYEEIGNQWRLASVHEGLAAICATRGDADSARALVRRADELRSSIGAPVPQVERPTYERTLSRIRELDIDRR